MQRVPSSIPGKDSGLWQDHCTCGNSSRGKEGDWSTGIQGQPGFKTGCRSIQQLPSPVPSPRTQVRLQGALSPKAGLGSPVNATEHGLAVPRH